MTIPSTSCNTAHKINIVYAQAIANAITLFGNDHTPFQPFFQLIKSYSKIFKTKHMNKIVYFAKSLLISLRQHSLFFLKNLSDGVPFLVRNYILKLLGITWIFVYIFYNFPTGPKALHYVELAFFLFLALFGFYSFSLNTNTA